MMAKILDGKATAAAVRAEVAEGVRVLGAQGRSARLDVILVGEDPASVTYVCNKQTDCAEVGMETQAHRFPEDAAQAEIEAVAGRPPEQRARSRVLLYLPFSDHLALTPLSSP